MDPTLYCRQDRRRNAVRAHPGWNGIDYVEVDASQTQLTLFFLGKAPSGLTLKNFVLTGGRRPADAVHIIEVRTETDPAPDLDDRVLLFVDQPGDFSTYTLRVVGIAQMDPRYDHVDFTFKAGCPTDLDCALVCPCPPPVTPEPDLNYLAKDYASFRQLLFDRLALLMPDWQERHVPDVGVTLVEVLAYVGDQLSYDQDAVGTEAYLETARRRVSVRRHSRLVDYRLSEGCNARAWVRVEVGRDLQLAASDLYFVTALPASPTFDKSALRETDLASLPAGTYEVFEPLKPSPGESLPLWAAHNEIHFYTWGLRSCCLPRGATTATLIGTLASRDTHLPLADKVASTPASTLKPPVLHLQPGDILVFEEVLGVQTGSPSDADPTHRQAVRLTQVTPSVDPLNGQAVIEIEWSEADALTFSLCLSGLGPAPECLYLVNISVARGNVLLVDHGQTLPPESLGTVPLNRATPACWCEGHPDEIRLIPGRFRPTLAQAPLTFAEPLPADGAAPSSLVAARTWVSRDPRQTLPAISLTSVPPRSDGQGPVFDWATLADPSGLIRSLLTGGLRTNVSQRGIRLSGQTLQQLLTFQSAQQPGAPIPSGLLAAVQADIEALLAIWQPLPDLLASGADDRRFVAELEEDGTATLRFGDGECGRQPAAGTSFRATYRIGNGTTGNVGARSIRHLVHRTSDLSSDVTWVGNPLPAAGGTEPESTAEAKLNAPFAFRTGPGALQRAVTAADYAVLAERNPAVQRAAAALVWTGSWYDADVALDSWSSSASELESLLARVESSLEKYRRLGHDLHLLPARAVPLDLKLHICVAPDSLRGHVKAALLAIFSNRALPDGRLGLFHPDNLTFGEGVYLSRLVAAAMGVAGVRQAQVVRLQRQFAPPNHEIENGVLPLGPLEVAQLDNDPNNPDRGKLDLELEGGR